MVDIGGVFETDQMIDSDHDKIDIYTILEEIGVNLQVKVDGVSVRWQNNGYIPELYNSEKVTIKLTCGENVWGFNVAPNKIRTVTGAKNHSLQEETKTYHKKITVIDGVRTDYPMNCIRLFRVKDHRFKVTEIGITFQNLDGFLTIQDIYEGDCYQGKDGRLVCPSFDDSWHSLSDFISQISIQQGGFKFPHVVNYKPQPKQKSLIPFRGGIVKWFNVNAGWGVIETYGGDAYVNYKNIISEHKPCLLKKGAEVTIKDLIVTHNGALKRKALGVKVV